jgi:cytochrome c oxidase subunit 3
MTLMKLKKIERRWPVPQAKPSAVASYFRDVEQQRQANTLGMWAFLVTEVMLFGGLFVVYSAYRLAYPDAFKAASNELDFVLATINTVILLTSSLMMALGVHAAQTNKKKALVTYLLLTILFGAIFLGIKGFEYAEKFEHHLVPGYSFIFENAEFANAAELFFALYFMTTGIHAFHMVIGIGVLVYMTYRAFKNHFSSVNYDPVEMTGLYWHFVDIAWVFIFPLYYLIDKT